MIPGDLPNAVLAIEDPGRAFPRLDPFCHLAPVVPWVRSDYEQYIWMVSNRVLTIREYLDSVVI